MNVTYKSWALLLSRAAGIEWVGEMVTDTKMPLMDRQPSECLFWGQQSPSVFDVVVVVVVDVVVPPLLLAVAAAVETDVERSVARQ